MEKTQINIYSKCSGNDLEKHKLGFSKKDRVLSEANSLISWKWLEKHLLINLATYMHVHCTSTFRVVIGCKRPIWMYQDHLNQNWWDPPSQLFFEQKKTSWPFEKVGKKVSPIDCLSLTKLNWDSQLAKIFPYLPKGIFQFLSNLRFIRKIQTKIWHYEKWVGRHMDLFSS